MVFLKVSDFVDLIGVSCMHIFCLGRFADRPVVFRYAHIKGAVSVRRRKESITTTELNLQAYHRSKEYV